MTNYQGGGACGLLSLFNFKEKSRCRDERVYNNNNNPPPPPKSQRKIIRSHKNPKCSPNLVSLDNGSDPACEKPLPSDPDQNIVCEDARVPSQSDEQMRENNPSQSTAAELKYFPLFNHDLPRHLTGSGKQNKVRKEKKLKVIPPANYRKITDHFRPASTNSERRDDVKTHLVRPPGCQR